MQYFSWSCYQEEVNLVGRVCCDSLGKMNAKSVILEGSRDTSAGRFIPLDLSDLKQYSLFPGQVKPITQTRKTRKVAYWINNSSILIQSNTEQVK